MLECPLEVSWPCPCILQLSEAQEREGVCLGSFGQPVVELYLTLLGLLAHHFAWS